MIGEHHFRRRGRQGFFLQEKESQPPGSVLCAATESCWDLPEPHRL